MTHRQDAARGRDILKRWCVLAEQRLDYLTEMFESGRWRRYHTEAAFLENIREAKSAVAAWRDLSVREAGRDNSTVDVSWLGRGRATPPRGEQAGDRPDPGQLLHLKMPELPEIAVAPPLSDVSMAGEPHSGWATAPSSLDMATAKPDIGKQDVMQRESKSEEGQALTLDIALMRERYPLLRNVQL